NQSEDIDSLLARVQSLLVEMQTGSIVQALTAVVNAIGLIPRTTRIPVAQEVKVSGVDQPIATGYIPAPGPGRRTVLSIAAYYDKVPTGGECIITGNDGKVYGKAAIVSANAGFATTKAFPEGVELQVSLTAGGTGVTGVINYAVASEAV
ncbi:MAG: hypothetical protein ACRC2U_06535, partial [Aeromonas sp.]